MNRLIPSKVVVIVIIFLIAVSSFNQSTQFARTMLDENTRLGEELNKVKEIIDRDLQSREEEDVVIMTRNPWEVFHSTRYKAIQIPNEGLEEIYEVAQKFQANYLLLPAPRRALEGIYSGEEMDERFVLVEEVPDSELVLFRIELDR